VITIGWCVLRLKASICDTTSNAVVPHPEALPDYRMLEGMSRILDVEGAEIGCGAHLGFSRVREGASQLWSRGCRVCAGCLQWRGIVVGGELFEKLEEGQGCD
jgi:hypothetical protein